MLARKMDGLKTTKSVVVTSIVSLMSRVMPEREVETHILNRPGGVAKAVLRTPLLFNTCKGNPTFESSVEGKS